MRCLVTGAAGFVGSHLAERLLGDGHEVCGIDAFLGCYPRYMQEQNLEGPRSWNQFRFIEGNMLDLKLPALLDGVDWVFHQAAQVGVRTSWGHEFALYAQCNILATQHLLEAILQYGKNIQRVVYASSSSVYGNTQALPVDELVTPHPTSPYGVTKLAAEHLCMLYYRNFGLPTVSLRYFTVYGPRQRPDMAFHHFCKAIMASETLRVYGDGYQTRDFTYVTDVVEANIRSAMSDAVVGEVFNIAGGSRVTIQQTISLLEEISGLSAHVKFLREQHGDVHDTSADITRARQLIGYQPKVALREGLAQQFESLVALYSHERMKV